MQRMFSQAAGAPSGDGGTAPGAGRRGSRRRAAGLLGSLLWSSAGAAATPFSHVFVIVLENTGAAQTIGNPNLPTLNALARKYGLATNYTGVAHPSLPNYVAMIAGSTFGSTSDDPQQSFGGDNLALQLERAGKSWKGYFQGLPSAGWNGGAAGAYAKKHNPFMLSADIAADPGRRRGWCPWTRWTPT